MNMTWKVATDTHWGEAREIPNHPTMARQQLRREWSISGFFKIHWDAEYITRWECASQCFLVYSQICATITSPILEHFHHLREDPQLLSYPSRPLHLLLTNGQSAFCPNRLGWFGRFVRPNGGVCDPSWGSLHLAVCSHSPPCGSRSYHSLPLYGWAPIVQIGHILLIHSSTDGHSTCFCLPS